MIQFGGLGVALVTPFNNSGDIDFIALKRLVNFQINQKVDYLVVLGTTAETATLSTNEKIADASIIAGGKDDDSGLSL